ncbi:helix-turn-helix domain-containing protein [Verrucomicrobiota bacterium]
MLVIAHRINNKNNECWPSVDRIAREAGFSKRTVQRYLRAVKNMGEIKIQHRSKSIRTRGGKQKTNLYQITLPSSRGSDTKTPQVVTESPKGSDKVTPKQKENKKINQNKEIWPIKIDDYRDIHNPQNDSIALACTITGEKTKFAQNTWRKMLGQCGEKTFRECLVNLWGEIKVDKINKPGAILTNKLKSCISRKNA